MTNKLTRTIRLATVFAALAFTHPAFAQDFGETVSAAMDAIREARDRNAAPENVKAIFAKASEAEEDGCLNFCGFYLGMPVEDARLLVAHYGLKNDEWGGRTVNGTQQVYRFEFSLKGVRRITKGGNSFDELSQAVANRIGTMKPKRNDDYDLVGYEYKNIDGQTALISEKGGLVLEDGNLARKANEEQAEIRRKVAAAPDELVGKASSEKTNSQSDYPDELAELLAKGMEKTERRAAMERAEAERRVTAERTETSAIEKLAKRYGLELEERGDHNRLSGNFAARAERLRATAEAYTLSHGIELDLSDDESFRASAEDALFLLTEGALKVMVATNRYLHIAGTSDSPFTLTKTLESLSSDLPKLRGFDVANVKIVSPP